MKKTVYKTTVFNFIATAILCLAIATCVKAAEEDGIYVCLDQSAYAVPSGVETVTRNGETVQLSSEITLPGDYRFTYAPASGKSNQNVYLWKTGDVHADGNLNASDLVAMKKLVTGFTIDTKSGMKAADVNRDGEIDVKDISFLRTAILGEANLEVVASVTISSQTNYYYSLAEAVDAANNDGNIGAGQDAVITLYKSENIAETLEIEKNIVIQNAMDENIRLTRANGFQDTMFVVDTGNVNFTLGSSEANEAGSIVIDGASETAIAGRIIENRNSMSSFVLRGNATLANATSTSAGAALENNGTAKLYGNVRNNSTSATHGGAIHHKSNEKTLFIYAGNYTENSATGKNGGVIYSASTGNIEILGGTFSKNTAANGAVVFCQYNAMQGTRIIVSGGEFVDNTATNAGGVLCMQDAGYATLNGGEFARNTALKGGAVYYQGSSGRMLKIQNGSFTENRAKQNGDSGGALFIENAIAEITGGSICKNTGTYRGGAIVCAGTSASQASLTISGGVITQNKAENQGGGAINLSYATLTITGGSIVDNRCPDSSSENYMGGGAILLQAGANVTVTNAAIHDNTATSLVSDGGFDIAFRGNGAASLNLEDDSFDGSVAWVFAGGNTAGTVKIRQGDDLVNTNATPITLRKGIIYTANYDNNTLVSTEYEYTNLVYNRSNVNGKFACYFIHSDSSMKTFENQSGIMSGDSTLLVTPNGKTMLIDCNLTSCASDVVAALQRLGINKIDYFVSTHAHGDHLGGWSILLKHIEIGQVYLTGSLLYQATNNQYVTGFLEALELAGIPYSVLYQGDTIVFDGTNVDVLWPSRDTDWASCEPTDPLQNDYSLVMKVTYNRSSFLFGADIETGTESKLVAQYGSALQADIVKMNHHGYNYSSESVEWVEAVSAKVAVAPHYFAFSRASMDKYLSRDIIPLYTGIDKTCLIYTTGDGIYDVQVEKDRSFHTDALTTNSGHFVIGKTADTMTASTKNDTAPADYELISGEYHVSDENMLRRLLRWDDDITIRITKDLDIHRELFVYGKKTIKGSHKLTMWLAATDEQAVIRIPKDAVLTMDGVTIDANGAADGIQVERGGELSYASGSIQYAAEYAVKALGTVHLDEVEIKDSQYTGVYAEDGSTVTIHNSSMRNAKRCFVYVAEGGQVTVTGASSFEHCICRAFWNRGTLRIDGESVTVKDNYYVFYNEDGGVMELCGVDVDTSLNAAIYAQSGTVTIENTSLQRQTNAAILLGGTAQVHVKNVEIAECGSAGIYASEDSQVTVEGLFVDGCRRGINCTNGGRVTGTNVRVLNAVVFGIASETNSFISLSDVRIGGTTDVGMYAYPGILQITDAQIEDTTNEGVKCLNGSKVTLNSVKIMNCGTTNLYIGNMAECTMNGESVISGAGTRGVYVDGGTAVISNSRLCANTSSAAGAAIRLVSGTLTIQGCTFADNQAPSGAAITIQDAKATIVDTIFEGNQASQYGGALYLASANADVDVQSCTFSGNSAQYGGAIYVSQGTLELTSAADIGTATRFLQNASSNGAAMFVVSGSDVRLGDYELGTGQDIKHSAMR